MDLTSGNGERTYLLDEPSRQLPLDTGSLATSWAQLGIPRHREADPEGPSSPGLYGSLNSSSCSGPFKSSPIPITSHRGQHDLDLDGVYEGLETEWERLQDGGSNRCLPGVDEVPGASRRGNLETVVNPAAFSQLRRALTQPRRRSLGSFGSCSRDNNGSPGGLQVMSQGVSVDSRHGSASVQCSRCQEALTPKCLMQMCKNVSDQTQCSLCGKVLTIKCILSSCTKKTSSVDQ